MKVKDYLLLGVLFLSGCMVGYQGQDDKITVGTVQRKISVGMPSAEVVEALGSPNIVSTDEERREVWIYDKIATDVTASTTAAGIPLLIFGSSSARSSSQRTLTVIIKFDKSGKVRDFAYHSSRF